MKLSKISEFKPVIGLEVHIQLKTKSKMFCGCPADWFGKKPNTQVCPVCLGLPGALPVPNKKAIEWTILAGLALGCKIPEFSKFDRKNYFYPDLPKGYQISQYDLPLCREGKLEGVRIRRVHLEEDTAKMIHAGKYTLVDFNRSGVPLMEIVTEPDIHSSAQAKEFLKKLTQIIRYLGISDCDMEKGTMRIEPNVSILKISNDKFLISNQLLITNYQLPKYKVELKNINSFRFVEKAIDYEIKRQIQLYESGKTPIQETRGWDEKKQVTYPQRIKEEAKDYRYFPEPDIPPLTKLKVKSQKLKVNLPELPEQRLARFVKEYAISQYYAKILTAERQTADYFEKAVKLGKDKIKPPQIANVIINRKINISRTSPAQLIKNLLKKQKIAKIGSRQLEKIITEVLKENQKAVGDYKKGKINAIQFLIGQVMAKTKGQANPEEAKEKIIRNIEI
ncbi:MAG: Asp-tRNA(Asn)/Glu-tRNA(Gln) amidotransferase subunit GatB [Microgenomates group bacterium]